MRSFQMRQLCGPLKGEITLPADKSIAHRAVILSAIAKGTTTIKNFAFNDDCLATVWAFQQLGIKIITRKKEVVVYGVGLRGLASSLRAIPCRESGTTMRLLLGVLAGQDFAVTLVADESLSKRPMRRVIAPLRLMGAKISAQRQEYPPITIQGGNLKQVTYKMPLASSQVKSALLLAGLYCDGITKIIEPVKTRDHTERMLKLFGAQIKIQGSTISIKGKKELESHRAINIPADISSATFFMVAAAILPGSSLVIKSVGLNPTRMGAIQVLKRMGADIKLKAKSEKLKVYEPVGDIIVKGSNLKGVRVRKEEIPSLIDEVPVLMVAACFACGQTVFEGVGELRVKETDRINSMMRNLQKMGAKIQVKYKNSRPDIFITGTKHLVGAKVSSFGDHRTAMSMAIAGLAAKGQTVIDDVGCISKSFPGFIKVLKALLP